MVGKDSGSGFWKQVHEGASQAVHDINAALGFTGSDKVELNYDAPADSDIAEQIDIIDQMPTAFLYLPWIPESKTLF